MDADILKCLNESFPELDEQVLKERIAEVSSMRGVPAGLTLIDLGQYIKTIPLVVKGKLRVFREDEDGNELFLYYLHAGDACALSLVCTLNDKISQVKAIAVEDTEIISLPIEYMDQLMTNHPSWYRFVIRSYGMRLQEMLKTIDSIAFHQMDERLLDYLKQTVTATGTSVISETHQGIAQALHTSREVVSRLLKQLEKRGVVRLGRNQIELLG